SFLQGAHDGIETLNEEALALARQLGDEDLEGEALSTLAVLPARQGDFAESDRRHQALLDFFLGRGDDYNAGIINHNWGDMALLYGDFARAATLYEQGLQRIVPLGQTQMIAYLERGLGVAVHHLGDYERGVALLESSLRRIRAVGEARGL